MIKINETLFHPETSSQVTTSEVTIIADRIVQNFFAELNNRPTIAIEQTPQAKKPRNPLKVGGAGFSGG